MFHQARSYIHTGISPMDMAVDLWMRQRSFQPEVGEYYQGCECCTSWPGIHSEMLLSLPLAHLRRICGSAEWLPACMLAVYQLLQCQVLSTNRDQICE